MPDPKALAFFIQTVQATIFFFEIGTSDTLAKPNFYPNFGLGLAKTTFFHLGRLV